MSAHRVLIVEDDTVAALLLGSIVEALGHQVTHVAEGETAIRSVLAGEFDLMLLDLGLPDIDGYEVARSVREHVSAQQLPIIFISGEQEPAARVRGFAVGGADFITKPYDLGEVRARVSHQLETKHLRSELELAAAALEQRVAERTAELSVRMKELGSEMERRRHLEDELRRLADTDPLTGLLNQRGFPRSLLEWRTGESDGLVVAVEVDGWESITGGLGHGDADRVLQILSDRLRSSSDHGPVGVYGAGLFVLGLSVPDGDQRQALSTLRRRLEEPVGVASRRVRLTLTIGAVVDTGPAVRTNNLLRDATLALHVAKRNPGETVVLGDEERAALADDLILEQELWGAAWREELVLQYQPIFRADTLRLSGLEALVRWEHPRRGQLGPGRFIPIAERSGSIAEIGEWTISEAVTRRAGWQMSGELHDDVTIAVNLSAVQAIDTSLPGRVVASLDAAPLDPRTLEIELTETALLRHGALARDVMSDLRRAGVGVSLDDFGTGSSSLTILQQVPADVVKLDRSFVSEMIDDPASMAIVHSTIDLAHRLGKRVVGEGVETHEQLRMLRDLGCDHVQGFLLSRPLDADQVPAVQTPVIDLRGRCE